jgi:glycosyltransferase involved in cell wall biosynthesis
MSKAASGVKSVCIVVQNVYDIDPRVRRKAEALVDAGYSVDVLALRGANDRKVYTLNGVTVRTIALGKKRGSLARYFFEYLTFFMWATVRVGIQMRSRSYVLIDTNSLPDFLVFCGCLARWQGAKLVLDLHEITPEFFRSKYGISERSWIIRLLTYLERISMDYADRVLTISDPVEDLLVSRGLERSKSTVIMNSVDANSFPRKTDASPAAHDEEGAFVMIYHGTLTPIYGLDLAVDALAMAQQEIPEARLWILGSGSEEARLKEQVAQRGLTEKVRLIGRVPPGDIPGWLARSQAGILPIRKDVFLDFAFPNKLPELIMAGKPTIVSRLRAIRHYFSEDTLIFCEPNDVADLARAMVRLCRDPERGSRTVAQARQAYQPIRWEIMKQRYLDLVGTLTASRKGSSEPSRPLMEPVR